MLATMQRHELLTSSIIRHAARQHPRAPVVSRLADGQLHHSDYATVERRSRRLAAALTRLGVRAGDAVATLAMNGHRHLELYYAIGGMGAVCNTVNPRLDPADVAYILGHAGAATVCVDAALMPVLDRALAVAPHGIRRIIRLDPGDVATDPLDYETMLETEDDNYEWPALSEEAACGICYTSGTTGRPKGVVYSHRSTVLHAMALQGGDTMALRSVDRVMPVVPMFHVNAWGTPYAAPMAGAALVMPGRQLDGASVLDLMDRAGVTFACGVPTIWLALLDHLRRTGARPATLQRMVVGGAACPRVLMDEFGALGIDVIHAWGLTESSPIATYNRPAPGTASLDDAARAARRMSVGRPPFGVELRAVDGDGVEVARDGITPGVVELRGPWVAAGYHQLPPVVDAEGWFATGDVGALDADGFVTLTDRTKDLIKSGGEWIGSLVLEDIAMSCDGVAEAAVIAARHPRWSERPLLLAVPREGVTLDPAALLAAYAGRVPRWWVPDVALVVEALPHGATGKLQKSVLRERFGGYLMRVGGG